MTLREQAIRDYIATHCPGMAHAKCYHELLWGIKFSGPKSVRTLRTRQLRAAIQHLVLAGSPIGSGRTGIYWCLTPEDYHAAINTLADESFPTLQRMRSLQQQRQRAAETTLL
jgi:hypothetical protein